MEIAVGTVIDDRYEVLGHIGSGAVAVVYLARHLQLGTLVAVKVLMLPTRAVQGRLLKEGRVQGALRDRNVVAVTDVVEVEGSPGLVMEYVRGPSLQRILQHLQFDLPHAVAVGTGILLGVRAAHQIGLVHRDLKPANVLIEVTDTALVPKIADFGLAKLLHPESEGGAATRTGSTLGTPAYMAPEQIRDARQVDERADVFSLGAVLYELLTGRRTFPGDDLLELYDRIREGRYTPVRQLVPEVPPELEQVVDAALKVDRDERISSVAELLDRWTGGRGEAAQEIEWSGAVLGLAASLAPEAARSTNTGLSGATFDFEPPVLPEAASVELVATHDPPRQIPIGPGLRIPIGPRSPGRRRPPLLLVLGTLGIGGAVLGCLGGAGLVGVGLATGYIQWGPKITVPIDRVRAVYTVGDRPRVSSDPAIDAEVAAAWTAIREARPEEALERLEPVVAGEARSDAGVHLLLATAMLWTGDPRAYAQIEYAGTLSEKRKGPVADLARIAAAGVHSGIDRGRVDAHRAGWPDDLLALLLLGSIDGWDPEQRVAVLEQAIAVDPRGAAGRVALAELLLERGREQEADQVVSDGLEASPGHPGLLAARAMSLLRAGDSAGARAAAEQAVATGSEAAAMLEPFAGALRTEGDLQALSVVEERVLAQDDDGRVIAFARGRAEAAFGLGKVEEATEWLDRAFEHAIAGRRFDDAIALFRLQSSMALLVGGRDGIARAWDRGRTVASMAGMPGALHGRLAPRIVLLEGLVAAHDADFGKAQAKLEELRAAPGGERLADLLELASFALDGLAPPDRSAEGCVLQAVRAGWLAFGPEPDPAARAYRALVGEGTPCGQHGLDRFVRARSEAALAALSVQGGDVAAVEAHLAEVARWAPEPDLGSPIFEDLAAAQEQLAWLREQ